MDVTQVDLQRPLLEGNIDEEQAAAILEEWNASVSAFVADDGGEDNLSCYCDSITPEMNSNLLDMSAMTNEEEEEEEEALVAPPPTLRTSLKAAKIAKICTSTLFPDGDPASDSMEESEIIAEGDEERRATRLVDGPWAIKFLKFVCITFLSIALVRKAVVAMGINDRDSSLTLTEIWRYESDAILRDLLFFFVIGRMHHRTGVDTIEWLGFALLANLYFESQNQFPWMQHSATPYEMHCLWPWQLWIFAVFVLVGIVGLALAHLVVACQQTRFWIVVGEFLFCVGAFILPVATSPYAHFHHWFAGWFFGMHTNLHHTWWSRAAMAYCWGMYVNGIAVYGRDPLLTCDYARFLARDQGCPMPLLEEAVSGVGPNHGLFPFLGEFFVSSNDLPDWRNCSSSGYHP